MSRQNSRAPRVFGGGQPKSKPILGDQFISIDAFCFSYSLSKTSAYRLIARGELDAIKIGRATRISRASIERWHASLVPMISTSQAKR